MRVAVAVALTLLVLLVPAVAIAAGPPDATTGAASSVAQNTATVAGTVNPQGTPTTYQFQYGTSTSYGLTTDPKDAGSGTSAVDASADLTGLTTDTTYHYRLVATNADGAVTPGADHTLHTAQPLGPPGATTGSARSVTATRARLTATVDPNGRATTYHFEYGTTTGYGKHTGEASAGSGQSGRSVSATISGLAANTRYHYRVVATNAAGVSRGSDRTFTTQRNPRGITLSATPNPVTWSGSTTVSGRVSGQGVGGATVALERQDFPFSGPYYLVQTKRALSSGRFSFSVGPLWALARLRVSTRTTIVASSPVFEVRNALRVGLRVSRLSGRRLRLQGSVSPAVPRGRASLRKRSPSGHWVTVRRASVKPLRGGRSRYAFTVRRRGTYRVVVLPRDNFAHVRGTSRERTIRR
jgi:hypothetical protein